MHPNIAASLDRVDELNRELVAEYNRALHAMHVTARATQLTHEVCERLRSVLDRLARLYWERKIAPPLSEDDRKAAAIYFPVAADQHSFDSTLGRWRWKSVREQHQEISDYLLQKQPFTNASNDWLRILNDLAVQGKHIDLVPQKREEARRITVARPRDGAVSWGPGVTFGGGVSVMGAPIDPTTQRIMSTPGVTETIETWVSFVIEGYGVNAAGFCADACRSTRQIAEEMTARFRLS